MRYHSRCIALAQTKDVGFISGHAQTKGRVRACTNQRQRGRAEGITNQRQRNVLSFEFEASCTNQRCGFHLRACTNQRQSQGMHKPKAERGRAEGITNQSQRNVLSFETSCTNQRGGFHQGMHKPKAESGHATFRLPSHRVRWVSRYKEVLTFHLAALGLCKKWPAVSNVCLWLVHPSISLDKHTHTHTHTHRNALVCILEWQVGGSVESHNLDFHTHTHTHTHTPWLW